MFVQKFLFTFNFDSSGFLSIKSHFIFIETPKYPKGENLGESNESNDDEFTFYALFPLNNLS